MKTIYCGMYCNMSALILPQRVKLHQKGTVLKGKSLFLELMVKMGKTCYDNGIHMLFENVLCLFIYIVLCSLCL